MSKSKHLVMAGEPGQLSLFSQELAHIGSCYMAYSPDFPDEVESLEWLEQEYEDRSADLERGQE
jgi:hypothetical protein